jgi:peptidoglycan hydrolase-like protein with peptidoglycan-binding domain
VRFEVIDSCPVPTELADEIREIKRKTGAVLNSCDRSPEAEPLLRQHGKMSQRQLFEGWVARRPGFNPANPPGRSTHERRNDGIAYLGPAGMPLRYWQVGMDWSNSEAVLAAARGRGWIATLTYPSNPLEGHHVNFRHEPKLPRTRVLKVGSRGADVALMQRRLHRLCSPFDGGRYLKGKPKGVGNVFGEETAEALKRFQTEHKLTADGIYGEQSHAQLLVSLRRQEQLRDEGLKKGGGRIGLVWLMQRRLKKAKDAQGNSYFPHRPNGRFGEKTEECVKRFQRDRGLDPDGIFGPLSDAALRKLLKEQRG